MAQKEKKDARYVFFGPLHSGKPSFTGHLAVNFSPGHRNLGRAKTAKNDKKWPKRKKRMLGMSFLALYIAENPLLLAIWP